MAHDVFISYSSKDKSIADAVCSILEKEQIRCWIAPRDIMPGVPFAEAIIDNIKASKVFLLIFSSNSNQSHQVSKEVERAVHHGISIIPLRIEDVPMSKQLEFYVSNVHWLDAITPPLENHIKKLSKVVKMLLSMRQEDEGDLREMFSTESGTGKKAAIPEKGSVLTGPASQPATLPFYRRKVFIPLIAFAGIVLFGTVAWLVSVSPGPDVDPPEGVVFAEGPLEPIVHEALTDSEAFVESVEPDPLPLPETQPSPRETAPVREEIHAVEPIATKPPESEPDITADPGYSPEVTAGIDAFDQGQYALSIRYMEEVLTKDPGNIYARYYLSEAKKHLEAMVQPMFESARQAFENGYYEESIRQLTEVLQLDPGHARSKQYMNMANTNLASGQITMIIHQYVRSVEHHDLLDFYEKNCTTPLYETLRTDIRLMLDTYQNLYAAVYNVSIRFVETEKAEVSFNCQFTGESAEKEGRQVLFDGLQQWVLIKHGDRWRIEEIELES